MGVKFDAIKDDEIRVEDFFATDMPHLMEQINKFLGKTVVITLENGEKTSLERNFRYVPICVTHSTETRPFTRGQMQFLDSKTTYHAVLLYKVVGKDD